MGEDFQVMKENLQRKYVGYGKEEGEEEKEKRTVQREGRKGGRVQGGRKLTFEDNWLFL